VWRDTLGQAGENLAADGNENDVIDPGDYALWKSQFGMLVDAGGGSTVPEPTGIWTVTAASLALALIRRT
jgi:hypothetical protein